MSDAMKAYPNWILWHMGYRRIKGADGVWRDDTSELVKLPVNPKTLRNMSVTNPTAGLTYEEAVKAAEAHHKSVGFIFRDNDPFFFLDIDDCIREDGSYNECAKYLLASFRGCFVEVSQSGRGLHIIGTIPDGSHHLFTENRRKKYDCPGWGCFDIYVRKRFSALTFRTHSPGSAAFQIDRAHFEEVVNYFFPLKATGFAGADWTTEPLPGWNGEEDDDALIKRMLRKKPLGDLAVLPAGAAPLHAGPTPEPVQARAVWSADHEALSRYYPPDNDRGDGLPYDHTKARGYILALLAFWTGKNCERMIRLFERSPLCYETTKWEERGEAFQQAEVLGACVVSQDYLGRQSYEQEAEAAKQLENEEPEGEIIEDAPNMPLGVLAQRVVFKGCVYIESLREMYLPDGRVKGPEEFNETPPYSSNEYYIDAHLKIKVKKPWEAYHRCQVYKFPRVHTAHFHPGQPPGYIKRTKRANGEEHTSINLYLPEGINPKEGDARLFIQHLRNIMPDEHTFNILHYYLAAVYQYPGEKFGWCPVIQGGEGIGKTIIYETLNRVYGHTHPANFNDLVKNDFNAWMETAIFACVNEFYLPKKEAVRARVNGYITDPTLSIQKKGVDQRRSETFVKYLMFTNKKDSVYTSKDTRRYCVIYARYQTVEDVVAAGLTASYFDALNAFKNDEDCLAALAHHFKTVEIPYEFNPMGGMTRAPQTVSSSEAFEHSLGTAEQILKEAIESSTFGFCSGWISSYRAAELLRKERMNTTPRKVGQYIRNLGYIPHPGLPRGRSSRRIMDEGNAQVTLYVHSESPNIALVGTDVITEQYIRDNTPQTLPEVAVAR